ncbi:unnamed protein product [Chilo suppressalis]|uniref:Uncharacterized protein n=1 Tax=Chilo suppressalis TaxID=168631 RepID=A0ABN8B8M3_CHISP|nr:unnamed protein product [Chilo suppressalis]
MYVPKGALEGGALGGGGGGGALGALRAAASPPAPSLGASRHSLIDYAYLSKVATYLNWLECTFGDGITHMNECISVSIRSVAQKVRSTIPLRLRHRRKLRGGAVVAQRREGRRSGA